MGWAWTPPRRWFWKSGLMILKCAKYILPPEKYIVQIYKDAIQKSKWRKTFSTMKTVLTVCYCYLTSRIEWTFTVKIANRQMNSLLGRNAIYEILIFESYCNCLTSLCAQSGFIWSHKIFSHSWVSNNFWVFWSSCRVGSLKLVSAFFRFSPNDSP